MLALRKHLTKVNNVIDIYEISHIRSAEMKSSEEWSSQLWTWFMQLCKKPEKKIQDFNGIWTFDLAILVWFSKQTHNWPAPNISDWCWKIMEEILKKFVWVVSEIYKKALKVQIWNEVALRQVVRKGVSFQDCKKENTSKFPCIKIW